MELDCYSDSISLLCMVPFILLLNSLTKGLLLYLLFLAALLNSWTNSSIVFPSYSNLLSSAILTVSSSLLLNSFLISAKNSPTVSYSSKPPSKSSNIFSFYTFADVPCIYDSIYYICFSTTTPLIFILLYSLQAIMKPDIFLELLLNICSLVNFFTLECYKTRKCGQTLVRTEIRYR